MALVTHFFLGANSGEGFCGLYEQLLKPAFAELTILKGGAGCGKSTLMRSAAREAERRGLDCVEIHCSGDPDSLDGVFFPALRKGFVDGTAPHVLEPRYMAVRERYLDFSEVYDPTAAGQRREEIIAYSDVCREAYREAYRLLRMKSRMESADARRIYAAADCTKLYELTERLLRQEPMPAAAGAGRSMRVFLGGITHKGRLCRFDTAEALCPRLYALEDSYGLAAPVLERLRAAAESGGEDALLCMDPDRPCRIQHLLLPRRGVGFVSVNPVQRLPCRAHRRISLDSVLRRELTGEERSALRLSLRVQREVTAAAVAALAEANEKHDALEKLYRPCIDFSRVNALTECAVARCFE